MKTSELEALTHLTKQDFADHIRATVTDLNRAADLARERGLKVRFKHNYRTGRVGVEEISEEY